MKRLFFWLLIVVLIGVSFSWGVAYSRYYIFPHSLVTWVARQVRSHEPEAFFDRSASGGVSLKRPSSIDLLRALGYVGISDVKTRHRQGATVHDGTQMQAGLSLFTTGHADISLLIDEEGTVVHQWSLPREQVWWDSPLAQRQQFVGLRSATVLPDLTLLAVFDYLGLVKLDRDSNPDWILRNGAHHDFWITGDDEIYLLSHRLEKIPEIHDGLTVVEDLVTVLDLDGRVKEEYSIVELVLKSSFAFLLPAADHLNIEYPVDLLHTNSIQVFDGALAHLDPRLFAKGNILLSLRNISTIVIADLQANEVLWAWGPSNITFQHSARLLPRGTILLFDNGLDRSTVIEIDPLSRKRIWGCGGIDGDPLRSRIYGACERQPNGNTLITDSMQARALEFTADGELVWSFSAPPLQDGRIPVLYGMKRYDRTYFETDIEAR